VEESEPGVCELCCALADNRKTLTKAKIAVSLVMDLIDKHFSSIEL
jgi:hypothetical protein